MNKVYMPRKTLQQARKEAGLTQNDLASLLKVRQPNIAKWESGDKPLPYRRLSEIAEYLRLKPDDIIVNLTRERGSP